jgi:hypothetical protein
MFLNGTQIRPVRPSQSGSTAGNTKQGHGEDPALQVYSLRSRWRSSPLYATFSSQSQTSRRGEPRKDTNLAKYIVNYDCPFDRLSFTGSGTE